MIVVGGGVIGCAVAYELAQRSSRCFCWIAAFPAATSASAGGLWPVGEAVGLGCGVIYHANTLRAGSVSDGHSGNGKTLPSLTLPALFRDFLVQSNALFPELAAELQSLADLDIEFAPGAGLIFVIENEAERHFVDCVVRSLPPGLRVDLLSPDEVVKLEPALRRDIRGGALLSGEYQVNPMLLAEAFKRAAICLAHPSGRMSASPACGGTAIASSASRQSRSSCRAKPSSTRPARGPADWRRQQDWICRSFRCVARLC